MKVLLRNIDASGQPMMEEGQEFSGRTPLAVVRAMRSHTMFGPTLTPDEYMNATASTAKRLHGVELDYTGRTPNRRARSFINSLIVVGWAELMDGKPKSHAPTGELPVLAPASVRKEISELRDSGLMRMSDDKTVIEVARAVGFLDTANWIENNPRRYRRGLKFGFVAEPNA